MKKTIFEGTINGTKFDNVQEYNAEMQRCISEGIAVEASSSTKTIETLPEVNKTEVNVDTELGLPGFEHCKDASEFDEQFIDAVLKEDYSEFCDKLERCFGNVMAPAIKKFNKETAQQYKRKVDAVLDHLGGLHIKYDKAVKELEGRIEDVNRQLDEIQEELDKVIERESILEATYAFYNDVDDCVTDKLSEYSNVESISKNDVRERFAQMFMDLLNGKFLDNNDKSSEETKVQVPQETRKYIDSLQKLCKAIFD